MRPARGFARLAPGQRPQQRDCHSGRQCTAKTYFQGGPLEVYPTRGLDVGAIETVRRELLEQRAQGVAILLISEQLDELLALSDRIAVLHGGEVMGVVDAAEADIEQLGLMMAGELHT